MNSYDFGIALIPIVLIILSIKVIKEYPTHYVISIALVTSSLIVLYLFRDSSEIALKTASVTTYSILSEFSLALIPIVLIILSIKVIKEYPTHYVISIALVMSSLIVIYITKSFNSNMGITTNTNILSPLGGFSDFGVALIPIVLIIVGLGIIKKPAYLVIPISLITTTIIVLFYKNLSVLYTGLAITEGAVMGIWPIVIVIVAAIFTYKMAEDQKDMNIIKTMLSNVSSDKRIIVLLVAWGFGSFLEGVAGYGTAVAIPVSILIAMGFDPFFACLLCLIMNTASTAYGSVGIPIISLGQATGFDVQQISADVAIQLIIPVMIIPFILVILAGGGLKGLKGMLILTFLSGASIAIVQIVVSRTLGPELPAILGSILSMSITIIYAKFFAKKDENHKITKVPIFQALLAWMPYILIVSLIILVSPLFKGINEYLMHFKSSVSIYPGADPIYFKWLVSPGVLILFATILTYTLRGVSPLKQVQVFVATLKKLALSSFVIICIVAISRLMTHSGMIKDLADGISIMTGSFYPMFSPLIGALGTFLTGSDTVSNVLFGPLQTQIAENINVNPYWLAAANTTGATGGKMISPQNITIATTTAALVGQEGKLLSKVIGYSLGYIIISGLFIYFFMP